MLEFLKRFFAKSNPAANQKGMTLVEIMVVLVILGSLIGILAPNVLKNLKKAKIKEAKIQMAEIAKQMELFYTDCGQFPAQDKGLQALVTDPGNCNSWGPEPYLKKLPKDPWGSDYIYEFDGSTYNIMSYGEDRRPGGTGYAADILLNEAPAETNQSAGG